MNEKLSFQYIIDRLAQMSGVSKKVAESFSKAFFDTIIEALSAGESLKIKGLGTFKLVEVGDRESVNVSTGMRFVIPGYKKVAFTAEDSVIEELNANVENVDHADLTDKEESVEPVSAKEEPVSEKEEPVREEIEEEPDIETLIQVPEPEQVEQPQDSFAGIDMLISTPESVEDIRQQYEEAKTKMETAVEEARKANAEKIRLEKLLERLEKNVEPERMDRPEERPESAEIIKNEDDTDLTDKEEPVVSVKSVESEKDKEEPTSDEEAKRQEAFNRVMAAPKTEEVEPERKKSSKRSMWLTLLIVLLVAILGVFVYLIYRNIEAVEQVQPEQTTQPAKPSKPAAKPAKPAQPTAPKTDKDSLQKASKPDSIKAPKPDAPKPQTEPVKEPKESPKTEPAKPAKPDAKPAKEQKPEVPKTHRMQRGESLTRVSQKYYGTKDSVRAILRINTFANPDNIPVGAVVKLP